MTGSKPGNVPQRNKAMTALFAAGGLALAVSGVVFASAAAPTTAPATQAAASAEPAPQLAAVADVLLPAPTQDTSWLEEEEICEE